jgi:hypothetical protein
MFTTYHDAVNRPDKPIGDGQQSGWHYIETIESRWRSDKMAASATEGEWGPPIQTAYKTEEIIIEGEADSGKPDAIASLKAVAHQDSIHITWAPSGDGTRNSLKYVQVDIQKIPDGDWVSHESTGGDFTYEFDRDVDGYPEKTDFDTWRIRALAVNIFGESADEYGGGVSGISIDTSPYGTWLPNNPAVTVGANKRSITLSMEQPPRADNSELYGDIAYGITISRPDIDGESFFTPAQDLDPYADESNYKTADTTPLYVPSRLLQIVPLSGQSAESWKALYRETQSGDDATYKNSTTYLPDLSDVSIPDDATREYDVSGKLIRVTWQVTTGTLTIHQDYILTVMPSPQNTQYLYKIVTKNRTTGVQRTDSITVGAIATAESAADFVDNAITQNKLAPDSVTVDKLAAGTVTAEKISAEDLLVKGARAGAISAEGIEVDDSGAWASKTMVYKYHDPVTGEEEQYTMQPREFFIGSTPDVTDERDEAEFLHYKSGQGFWFKIKNFMITSLKSIIWGTFQVFRSGNDAESATPIFEVTDGSSPKVIINETLQVNGINGEYLIKTDKSFSDVIVNGDIVPPEDNYRNVGYSTQRWQNIIGVNGVFTNLTVGGKVILPNGGLDYSDTEQDTGVKWSVAGTNFATGGDPVYQKSIRFILPTLSQGVGARMIIDPTLTNTYIKRLISLQGSMGLVSGDVRDIFNFHYEGEAIIWSDGLGLRISLIVYDSDYAAFSNATCLVTVRYCKK